MGVDAASRKEFWTKGLDPYENAPPMVCLLVDLADIIEAALWSKRFFPEMADEIHRKAVQAVRDSKADGPITYRALAALGEVDR